MSGYRFTVSCLACGGQTVPVTRGVVNASTETKVTARCVDCAAEYLISTYLRRIPGMAGVRQHNHRAKAHA